MVSLRYLPIADEDIQNTVEYIGGKLGNPGAADLLLEELDKAGKALRDFPYGFQPHHSERPLHDELRWAPVKGYVLYYTVIGDTVEIRRFLHGRKDRKNLESVE